MQHGNNSLHWWLSRILLPAIALMTVLCSFDTCSFDTPFAAESAAGENSSGARLYIVNVYDNLRDSGKAAYLRVRTPDDGTGTSTGTVLGVATVEDDGSVFMIIPPETPVMLELVGISGTPLSRTDKPIIMEPGELRGMYRLNEPSELSPPAPVDKRMPTALTREPDTLAPEPRTIPAD